jgi:hypothetical protein
MEVNGKQKGATEMEYENRYASIEQDASGTWATFNDVTGLLVAEGLTYQQARARMIEIYQHYHSIEFKRS